MKKLFFIVIILFLYIPVFAATYYVDTDSVDDTGIGSIGDPKKYVQSGIGLMSANDTLELADGVYDNALDKITSSVNPPDGSGTGSGDARFTIIKATNQGQVRLKSISGHMVDLGADSHYIKFEGIIFEATATSNVNYAFTAQTGTTYIYLYRCGIFGSTGGASAYWMSSSYNLVEECYSWGRARYGFHFHGSGSQNNIVRRSIVRLDAADGGGNPVAAFISYGSSNVEYQNCIAIDMDRDDMTNVSFANLAFLTHSYVSAAEPQTSNNFWRGDIVLNIKGTVGVGADYPFGILNDSGSSPNHNTGNEVHNSVVWDLNGKGIVSTNADSDLAVSNSVVGEIAGSFGDIFGGSNTDLTIIDSIGKNWSRFAFNDTNQPTYSNVFDDESNTIYDSTTTGTNMQLYDPELNGLLYLTRVEAASNLITAGSGGGQIGATILKRYGVDGTFYGEDISGGASTDYKDLTATDLWPFPYEAQIKSDFSEDVGTLDETRGFCTTDVNSRTDTGVVTLTSYIWEYLGNTGMTAELYGIATPSSVIGNGSFTN